MPVEGTVKGLSRFLYRGNMNTRTMYAIAFTVYIVFVMALIVMFFHFDGDEDAQMMAMYSLSSGVSVAQ